MPARRDLRPAIYLGLDVLFAAVYAIVIVKAIPNRMASAQVHLWSLPLAAAIMAAGTSAVFVWPARRPLGRRVAIAGASLMLASTILLIARVLVSAAFLSGVYGAFGKAAALFALVAIAIVVEVVALLPLVQLKYLMSRAGRRAYGA